MLININRIVEIKLNDIGLDILKQMNEAIKAQYPKAKDFNPPEVDSEGYSKWILWDVMTTFGSKIGFGGKAPFDTKIRIDDHLLEKEIPKEVDEEIKEFLVEAKVVKPKVTKKVTK